MKTRWKILPLLLVVSAITAASAQELFVYQDFNSGGQAFALGGAENQAGNTITRLLADDLTPLPGFAGQAINNLYFSVANLNAVAVSARPRLRMWMADGTGGTPGTFIAGFSFSAITFNANTSGAFFFHPTGVNVPNGTFWIGLTFDDNNGTTGATAAQLNNLGMAIADPPTIGTSADVAFGTTAAGSFLVNNPAGSTFNFNGTPPANFYFGMSVVPEPSSLALAGLAATALLLRRRNAV